MICDKFEKVTRKDFNYYIPILEDYIHSNKFKKERGNFGFKVPEEVKCKQAVPVFPLDNEIMKKLSLKSQIMGTTLFQLFVYSVENKYPEIICVEIEGGKYLKYQFQYYFTYDFMNIPSVYYEPVEVVSKKEAKKYLVCIDQE